MKKSTPVADGFTPPETSILVMLGSEDPLFLSSFRLEIALFGLPTTTSFGVDFAIFSTLDFVLDCTASSAMTL